MEIADSNRLQYRLMSEDDADLMFELDQDPEVMRYINGGTMTTRVEVRDVYIPRMKKYTDAEKGWGIWIVSTQEDVEFVGWVLVRPMNFFSDRPEFDNLELGWRFKRAAWGKGYATEAAKSVMSAIEKKGDCARFSALAMEDNTASIRIMKKLGMQYIKTDIHVGPLGEETCVFYGRDVAPI